MIGNFLLFSHSYSWVEQRDRGKYESALCLAQNAPFAGEDYIAVKMSCWFCCSSSGASSGAFSLKFVFFTSLSSSIYGLRSMWCSCEDYYHSLKNCFSKEKKNGSVSTINFLLRLSKLMELSLTIVALCFLFLIRVRHFVLHLTSWCKIAPVCTLASCSRAS